MNQNGSCSSAIEIIINGAVKRMPAGSSLDRVLDSSGLKSQRGIAVAINDTVVPRSQWADSYVQSGDSILIITATQGG